MAQVQVQAQNGSINNGTVTGNNRQYMTTTTSLYVGDLDLSVTETQLYEYFSQMGPIFTVRVCKDMSTRRSLGYGYVNYGNPQDAARALEHLNFTPLNGKPVRIIVTDEILKELFSPYGSITSYKVVRDPSGISKGSGFVAFSTPEEASLALAEMNGKMVISKPLYVALAQRKEERRARLQAQFSQMRSLAMVPSVAPRMPMYSPGGPGLGQQIFYGQGPPTIFPPQPGFGYQQQLVPGMRPGGAPMPNFFVPMVQQGQQGQRPNGRRGGAVQQNQQPVPLMQQQMLPRGRVYPYSQGRGLPDGLMPNVAGGMLSVPYEVGGMPMRDASLSQLIPIGALASALANSSPEHQRTMLGDNLYPLVEQLEPESAAKVTGMLLEMDQTEVLHLLESPEALKAKVAEAMEVLRTVALAQQQQSGGAADQLASLT
ncbi:hypothetical protein V6N11_068505 [Hibiscus sabdariffa]|uniref:Uncharacterized protein n=1 Tax=Hibiscus sabdariffa TaxID=183260 RepID=A0ABR2P9X1_9ROSI